MDNKIVSKEYVEWLNSVKKSIRVARVKAAVSVNSALVDFYFNLGKVISGKEALWGSKFLEQLSHDLRKEFSEVKGFSVTNLKYCRLFYKYVLTRPQSGDELENRLGHQTGDEIASFVKSDFYQQIRLLPWGHIKLLISKIKVQDAASFYISKAIENGWSRDVLALQIKSKLHERQGNAITNFKRTLPTPQGDLAQQLIKDPYRFDFLEMTKLYNERDIENQLIKHVQSFLLELGKGFAFVGNQYHLEVAKKDYYLDLLFYHIHLRCYVVVELKNCPFKPEYTGKLNFYLSAVDSLVKSENENPTIGILLCRDKNKIETEFALRGMTQPMGVSEFYLTEVLPEELKGSMPTIEEIEQEFKQKGFDTE